MAIITFFFLFIQNSNNQILFIDPNFSDKVPLTPIKASVIIFYDPNNVARMIVLNPVPIPNPIPLPTPQVSSKYTPIIKQFNLPQDILSIFAENYGIIVSDIEHTRITSVIDAQGKLITLNRPYLNKNPNISPCFQAIITEANKKKYFTITELHDLYAEIRDGFLQQ